MKQYININIKMKAMRSGSIQKTSFCPNNECDWKKTGDSRTVNSLKELHIKYCPFIKNELRKPIIRELSSLHTTSPLRDVNDKRAFCSNKDGSKLVSTTNSIVNDSIESTIELLQIEKAVYKNNKLTLKKSKK